MQAIFNLSDWDNVTSAEREQEAQQIAALLPADFIFTGLERHSLGGQSHEIAFVTFEDVRFVLLPGFSGMLGYDRNGPSLVSSEQAANWKKWYDQFCGEPNDLTLVDDLSRVLTPYRQASLFPFLIEVEAVERPEMFEDFDVDDEVDLATYARMVAELICKDGFRPPTLDEWEYACSGGTKTLFRWGTETPEADSARVKDWDMHMRPNAFGLRMNFDTYKLEVCENGILRGGDGGVALCGGYGVFETWLPLATGFACPLQHEEDFFQDEPLWRRVYPLDTLLRELQ